MTDWSSLLSSQRKQNVVKRFATGELSGKQFYSSFKNTNLGGTVRNLFRTHGVVNSRRLARKALVRRGVTC